MIAIACYAPVLTSVCYRVTAHGALYAMVTIQCRDIGRAQGMVIMRLAIKRPPEIRFASRPYFTRRSRTIFKMLV